ncbi:MAG: CvpA family protein [Candidatus Marinimicrobia bacterium]|nr:CvpA family protein [Candidatus Neomarinimicrobiota bacterium]
MGNLFDVIFIVVIGLTAFFGLRKGVVESVIKLIGFIVAVYLATKYNYIGADLVRSVLKSLGGAQTVVGFVLVFLVVYLFFTIISMLLKNIIHSFKLARIDRAVGVVFGALKGLIILAMFVWVLSVFPEAGIGVKFKATSFTYPFVESFEIGTARVFNLDDDLAVMRSKIRQTLFLEEKPIIPTSE